MRLSRRRPPVRTPRSASVDFRGEKRSNETHVSPSDPEAKLYRKANAHPVTLYFMGHVLMEHRHGRPVDVEVTAANGCAEREAALTLLDRLPKRRRRTLAADKAYDVAQFLADCRQRGVTPHIACNDGRTGGSALDARTTRHAGYLWSPRIRKRIEEGFGWGKDGRPLRKMKHTGHAQLSFIATLTIGCYALLRVAKLLAPLQPAPT